MSALFLAGCLAEPLESWAWAASKCASPGSDAQPPGARSCARAFGRRRGHAQQPRPHAAPHGRSAWTPQ
eukprot:2448984-Rhodomonas_salina.1